MIYLTKDHFILINKLTIQAHGGNYVPPNNFLHESALDYLVEAVSSELFGEPLYKTISEKAGLYIFNIISNHIFTDGNKRTGLEAGLLFLKLNGYQLSSKINDEILTDFIISVASGKLTLEMVQNWVKENIELIHF